MVLLLASGASNTSCEEDPPNHTSLETGTHLTDIIILQIERLL